MVSITDHEKLFSKVVANDNLKGFWSFLFEEGFVAVPSDYSNTVDGVSLAVLSAIQKKDRQQFLDCCQILAKREPKKTSPWIYDDMMVFVFLLGEKEFGIKCDWMREILKIRYSTQDEEKRRTTEIFNSITTKSINMQHQYGFIGLVFQALSSTLNVSENDAFVIYKNICEPGFYEQLSPFLKILALRAKDTVLAIKGLEMPWWVRNPHFYLEFPRKVENIGNGVYWVVLIFCIVSSIAYIYFLFHPSGKWDDVISKLGNIQAIFGMGGIITLVLMKKKLSGYISKGIFRYFRFK